MIFKDVLKKTNWEKISEALLKIYPDQKKIIEGYETVYKKLQTKKPNINKYVLIIPNNDFENRVGVYAVDGKTKRKDGSFEQFGLGLSPWSKWLGAKISRETIEKYSIEEIAAHCLFEMTFYGFTENKINSYKKDLELQIKDSDDPVRYMVACMLFGKTLPHYFSVESETWCSDINSGTIFKREKYARAILKTVKEKGSKDDIIIKITTKNKKRKILKYMPD